MRLLWGGGVERWALVRARVEMLLIVLGSNGCCSL